jgi:hypothetical protein
MERSHFQCPKRRFRHWRSARFPFGTGSRQSLLQLQFRIVTNKNAEEGPLAHPVALESIRYYIHFMHSVASQLSAFMERQGLKQSTLARNAEVSQSTVSRALRGLSLRHGAARSKLFKYAGIVEPARAISKAEASQLWAKVFDQIWDESDVHADAIVRIITVLTELGEAARARRR